MPALISVEHLIKSYDGNEVLHGISFQIQQGQITGLLGPNGAGKTTMIRILTGITGPDQGKINWHDQNVRVGYLPEERGLYRKMTVWDHAIYILRLRGLSNLEAANALEPWFDRLRMKDWRNRRIETLSKGMQQRLQFVICVAPDPDLLILDEPFSGFDPVNADELKKEIIQLRGQGKTIILSTHNMGSVEELCDSVVMIHKGSIILNGTLDEVKDQFSKKLFRVVFKGSQMAFANILGHSFEVVSMQESDQRVDASIKGHSDVSNSTLLKNLAEHVEIESFTESLPSMNDIFIDLVTKEEAE